MSFEQMMIVKRDGRKEPVSFDKILIRIKKASEGLSTRFVKPEEVSKSVIAGIYDGCTTKELDTLAATVAANKICDHPDYSKLASRITVSRLLKETPRTLLECVTRLWDEVNPATGEKNPKIREDYFNFVVKNETWAQALIESHSQYDYRFDFPGIKSLEQSYLLKNYDKVIETPQYLWFRVAYEIHRDNKEALSETFSSLSKGLYIHATPTLFNSGLNANALSSCFLYGIEGDSLLDIFNAITQSAMISKNAGGIGIHVSNIRAAGSPVRNGDFVSSGIVPMLRVLNDTMRYCDQSGKRPGAAAVYLEPWHSDIMAFLELRLSTGKEELRTRDLFTALWIPDRFMRAVQDDEQWYMFSPDSAVGLQDAYGETFDELYDSYVKEGIYLKALPAREVWKAICKSQIETGTPYICYKDSVNKKSNHKNLGTIRSSNLCSEIMEYSSGISNIASCNLASLILPQFYDVASGSLNTSLLEKAVKELVKNLDEVIDNTSYAVEGVKDHNLATRPLGIGAQGFADLIAIAGFEYDSQEAKDLTTSLFESIYFYALEASCELAQKKGVYSAFAGSPYSQGLFQFDLWGKEPSSKDHDWKGLKKRVKTHGLRNSLLLTIMPNASTSVIAGVTEACEPITSNLYTRKLGSKNYTYINTHLVKDLEQLGLWSEVMKQKIMAREGSVFGINEIPIHLQRKYATAYEISAKAVIDHAALRGIYIDQSQSMNIFMRNPTVASLTSMHFHGWKKGLKTGMYYLRSNAAVEANKVTIDRSLIQDQEACNILDPTCESCSA